MLILIVWICYMIQDIFPSQSTNQGQVNYKVSLRDSIVLVDRQSIVLTSTFRRHYLYLGPKLFCILFVVKKELICLREIQNQS